MAGVAPGSKDGEGKMDVKEAATAEEKVKEVEEKEVKVPVRGDKVR